MSYSGENPIVDADGVERTAETLYGMMVAQPRAWREVSAGIKKLYREKARHLVLVYTDNHNAHV